MLILRLLIACGAEEKYGALNFDNIEILARKTSRKKTTSEFKAQLARVNPNIVVLGEYLNTKSGIEVQCSVCGHVWSPSPNNLLRGAGCPECKNKGASLRKSKPVLCVETGVVYESLASASESVNCGKGAISACCRGKQELAGGFHWQFVEK